MYTSKGNQLFYKQEPFLELSADIVDFLQIEKGVVVLLDPIQTTNCRNISCYSDTGELLWNIDKVIENFENIPQPYTGILITGDKLMGYNRAGYEVEIDKQRGSVIDVEFVK